VASPTAGFVEAIRPGETGLLANTPAEWERSLEELVTHPELRARLGAAACREVEERYTVGVCSAETAGIFRDIVKRFARSADDETGGPAVAEVSFRGTSQLPPWLARIWRVGRQIGSNVKRLLNPFFWDRVLRRWEGRGDRPNRTSP
jgi:hypothetical protein